MRSFLLPSPTTASQRDTLLPAPTGKGDGLVLYQPGSAEWMRWFQNRPGTTPQDAGSTALDYDMVFAFKSIPIWAEATGVAAANPAERTMLERVRRFRQEPQYHGVPQDVSNEPRKR